MAGMYSRLIRELCRRVSPITQRLGFVLSPVHFYFPIPDTRDLDRRFAWDQKTGLAGIDWNLAGQLKLVLELAEYGHECDWPGKSARPGRYTPENTTFGFTSGMLADAMVRRFRPRRIVEVGVGWSTLVLTEAAARNAAEGTGDVEYQGYDPYPPKWLPGNLNVKRTPIQEVEAELLTSLESNDILFIDSSHVLNTGSDVQYLYLEVLPQLRPGVIVHVHDIQLPQEYPRYYAVKQRWFWNEQYLLQAFLACNDAFEILLAGHYLCTAHAAELQAAFPHYRPAEHSGTGSFWMRRSG